MFPTPTWILYVKTVLGEYTLLFPNHCDVLFSQPVLSRCKRFHQFGPQEICLALDEVGLWIVQCQKTKIGRHTRTPVDSFRL